LCGSTGKQRLKAESSKLKGRKPKAKQPFTVHRKLFLALASFGIECGMKMHSGKHERKNAMPYAL
jgi:hypothetical protein